MHYTDDLYAEISKVLGRLVAADDILTNYDESRIGDYERGTMRGMVRCASDAAGAVLDIIAGIKQDEE